MTANEKRQIVIATAAGLLLWLWWRQRAATGAGTPQPQTGDPGAPGAAGGAWGASGGSYWDSLPAYPVRLDDPCATGGCYVIQPVVPLGGPAPLASGITFNPVVAPMSAIQVNTNFDAGQQPLPGSTIEAIGPFTDPYAPPTVYGYPDPGWTAQPPIQQGDVSDPFYGLFTPMFGAPEDYGIYPIASEPWQPVKGGLLPEGGL